MSSAKWTRQFHNNGYDSWLLTSKGAPAADQCREWGLNVIEIKEPRDYLDFSTRKALRKVIAEKNPQAFFNHLTRDLWHLSPVLKKYPDICLFNFARMFIRGVNKKDFLHKYIYSRLNKMIALSHIQKSLLLKALPIPSERYTVIPNAVDTERFQPRSANPEIRKQLGVKEDTDLLVGLIGRIDELKGHMEFVEAANLIATKHPHVQFVMVGANTAFEGDAFANKVNERIHDLGLDEKITRTDHRKDIPEIMNALDVFCMPSYEENFGNVMLEALASGTASVGTNSGGTPEQLEDGHTGLLVSPRSGPALAGGILRLVEDHELRDFIGKNARASALDRFHLDIVFRQAEELLMPCKESQTRA